MCVYINYSEYFEIKLLSCYFLFVYFGRFSALSISGHLRFAFKNIVGWNRICCNVPSIRLQEAIVDGAPSLAHHLRRWFRATSTSPIWARWQRQRRCWRRRWWRWRKWRWLWNDDVVTNDATETNFANISDSRMGRTTRGQENYELTDMEKMASAIGDQKYCSKKMCLVNEFFFFQFHWKKMV